MTATHNTWLYAVVPADRLPPPDISGVAGESLRAVVGPGIAAVAGSVPCVDFDAEPLHAHLEDVAWLERAVRAHHRVIGALAQTGPVLPMRFATLYRDDQRSAAMLHDRQDELLAALQRIANRTEWGVKVYLAPPSTAAPQGGPGDRTAAADRPGTAYLLRRKAQRQDRHEALRRALNDAQQIHAALAATAAESTQHPLQTVEAAGRNEPMVLNGAYLIDDSHLADFDKALVDLAPHHPELHVEVTGPWPPYSFSGVGAEPAIE